MSQHLEKVLAVTIEIFDAVQSSLALVNDDNHEANRCSPACQLPDGYQQLKIVSARHTGIVDL
jgi:hypothetical protein